MRRTVKQSVVAVVGTLALGSGLVALPLSPASAAGAPPTGVLRQLPGTQGCIQDVSVTTTSDGCATSSALKSAGSMAVTSDGAMVYVAGTTDGGSISAYQRDPITGALTQLAGAAGCATIGGNNGCKQINNLDNIRTILLSPDNSKLFVATGGNAKVLILSRASDGTLSRPGNPSGCIQHNAGSQTCSPGTGIPFPYGLAVNGAGTVLYVTSLQAGGANGSLASYDLSGVSPVFQACLQTAPTAPTPPCKAANGLVSPTGVAVTGTDVYVAAFGNGDGQSGAVSYVVGGPGLAETACYGILTGCATARATAGGSDVVVSPDGKNVYLAGYSQGNNTAASILGGGVAVFNRATTGTAAGTLMQPAGSAGCIVEASLAGDRDCAQGRGLKGAGSLAIPQDGQQVYVASELLNTDPAATGTQPDGSNAIAVLNRSSTGTLTQVSSAEACHSSGSAASTVDGCTVARGLRQPGNRPRSIALTPAGGQVYASGFLSNTLAAFNRQQLDLAITTSAPGQPYVVGRTNTLTLTATNAGPLDATNVIVTDVVTNPAAVVSATPSQGTCSTPPIVCNLGSLASGGSATVAVRFLTNAVGTATNTAKVRADQTDLAQDDNTSVTSLQSAGPGLTAVSGGGQKTQIGTSFGAPLKVALRDASGQPIAGATVTFTAPSTSPSAFFGSARTESVTTDSNGVATSTIPRADSGPGDYSVTASTPTVTSVIFALTNLPAGSSPSPTATATPSDTPTATMSPRPSGSPTGRQRLVLDLTSPGTITPGTPSTLRGFGTAGQAVTLRCYSRTPANSQPGSGTPPYFDARNDVMTSSGTVAFSLNPGTNTRCFLRYSNAPDSDATTSDSVVQNVATALSLSAYRDGVRRYHFQGRNLPRRSGQLITLYRVTSTGQEVRTATTFTDATGIWRIDRTFTGSGQFSFRARTSQTLTNAAGVSNTRLTVIY